jgi:hypothetical protein
MRWLVWCLMLAAGACAKSHDAGPASGGSSGAGASVAAGSGGASGSASGGAGMADAGRASSGSSGVGGDSGRAASGAGGQGAGSGGTGGDGEIGGAGSASGGATAGNASAGEANGGEAGAPAAECGPYDACGCGCCGGTTPTSACYYPERGDLLSSIIAADQAAGADPECESAGCALGIRHLCCVTPEPSAGTYAARLVPGGYDRLIIERRGSAERCSALGLVRPLSAAQHTFPIETPGDWGLERAGESACVNGMFDAPGRSAVGGIGSVSYSSPDQCALDFDLTLFFVSEAGELESVRFQAENVALGGC